MWHLVLILFVFCSIFNLSFYTKHLEVFFRKISSCLISLQILLHVNGTVIFVYFIIKNIMIDKI